MKLLVQTQLSNISNNKFILEADSGWQMCINRVREMLKLSPDLCVDIMGPDMDEGHEQCVTHPVDVNPDLWKKHGLDEGDGRLGYIGCHVLPNALVTRYDFDWLRVVCALDLGMHKIYPSRRYDAVYVNDPMHLRNLKAAFHVIGDYQPKFFVHSHFVDCPSCPKFPSQASLWHGQVEATIRADWNFWQCSSALREFEVEARKLLKDNVVDEIMAKSSPWDDGYSIEEITTPVDENELRFTKEEWESKTRGKLVLFFPNRISPSSGDYTNGMKFMFELLPQLRQRRQDFVVVCGNPNLKFSNDELLKRCGDHGYVKLHDFSLNRDEYKFVARNSDVVVALYDKDTYGGTAARECIELGCTPLFLDVNEYKSLAREANNAKYPYLCKPDFSDFVDVAALLVEHCTHYGKEKRTWNTFFKHVVQSRCSFESTTKIALEKMGVL